MPQINDADNFIAELNEYNKKNKSGGFFTKYFWSPTATISGLLLPFAYEIYTGIKVRHLKKLGNKQQQIKHLQKTFLRNVLITSVLGLGAVTQGLQYIFNKQSDKNFNNLKKDFDKTNTHTNAQLSDDSFCSTYEGASYNIGSGEIRFNKNLVNDPYTRRFLEGLIRHELVHARQFETIARSKDGLKKINYAFIITLAKNAQNNKSLSDEFDAIYKNIAEDTSGKYDNQIIKLNGAEINFKKYITALNTLIHNPKATYNDIPMVINEDHYQKVIDKKGALTPEEEKKAEQYYEAAINYAPLTAMNAYNPFSDYRNNILEKEAYKENPSWLMKMINKQ